MTEKVVAFIRQCLEDDETEGVRKQSGEAVQVDWGEAVIYINGVKQKTNLFCARLCHSCVPVVIAHRRQNEESFLDAFVQTFKRYGGVPEKVIFDNGKVAVKDGFGAHARKHRYWSSADGPSSMRLPCGRICRRTFTRFAGQERKRYNGKEKESKACQRKIVHRHDMT